MSITGANQLLKLLFERFSRTARHERLAR